MVNLPQRDPWSQRRFKEGRYSIVDDEHVGHPTSQNAENIALEYYVDNAKIIRQAEHRGTEGKTQLLYVIDELLEPYKPISAQPPTSLELLKQPSIYGLNEPIDFEHHAGDNTFWLGTTFNFDGGWLGPPTNLARGLV
ncbi:uncharacterized protein TNCV_3689521 [Trichonephila clavipes]|uniref:Amine oxidase n=1 Tax=Trichonephila clavipes TaxID=2585209 RepID=A0A8X6VL14_TRICX|nr:uncharacterized protein TNCV_3689521 [Trichonephila clavipes]